MHPIPKKLFPFLWHFIKPYKWLMFFLLSTGLFFGIQMSLNPYLLKLIIDIVTNYHGDKADIFQAVQTPVLIYVGFWIFIAVIFRLENYAGMILIPDMRRDITNAMFAYLNRHSYGYMQNNFAGSLANKISDISGGSTALIKRFDETVGVTCVFLIALATTFLVNPIFTLLLLIWAIAFLGTAIFFATKTRKLAVLASEGKSALAGKIVDAITNLTNIRLFARSNYENIRLQKTVDDVTDKDRATQLQIIKMRIACDISTVLLIASLLGTLVYMYSKGKITIGDFAFIMTISVNIFVHIWNLANQFVQFAEDLGRCSQALTIINSPHEIVDIKGAKPLQVESGNIVFDNVSFNYSKNNNLFKNKSVEIIAGSKVGLVGFSGSGKTTFVNLILRFFDIESGKILIDGQDISKVTQDSLHENISMIPQDTSLFHRSLMENIRYGKLDANDEEVIAASKKSHCHEFISSLPEGYNSLVGERGIKLSGGQRQRIAIARAMLKNAPILILDEATSALDSVTEKYIQDGLNSLMQNRTTIVIAHRLSTLSQMDRILVFDKGHIIEDGTHQELLLRKGHYSKMWEMQAGGFLPDGL